MEPKYGPVMVTKSKYKGIIGYYDDDDLEKAVVYRGELCRGGYVLVPYQYLTYDITVRDLKDRIQLLRKKLAKFDLGYTYDCWELNSMHEELHFSEKLLYERYFHHYTWSRTVDKKVFISHASQDTQLAIDIALDLKEYGINSWLDKWDIKLGHSIPKEISAGLDNCCAIIMLYSKSYKESTFCNDEWESFYMRFNREKPYAILPILLDDLEPPSIIAARKYMKFNNSIDQYSSLIHEIVSVLELKI